MRVCDHIGAFYISVWLHFLKEKKLPESDQQIPLTLAYIRAMGHIQSVIDGSDYKITCNYKSIHVPKRIFDHLSRFRFITLL